MISVYVPCSTCRGECHIIDRDAILAALTIQRCGACDGLGRQWAPGGPAFGCTITLADREPGEIVTLGNGERAKILWHQPHKQRKVVPETTFIDLLEPFTDAETFRPVPYPSCVGVETVDVARNAYDRDDHDGERSPDYSDPMQRPAAGRMI